MLCSDNVDDHGDEDENKTKRQKYKGTTANLCCNPKDAGKPLLTDRHSTKVDQVLYKYELWILCDSSSTTVSQYHHL